MTTLYAALLLATGRAKSAPKRFVPVQRSNGSAWTKGVQSPAQLAAVFDSQIKALNRTKLNYGYDFQNKYGHGQGKQEVFILTNTVFNIATITHGASESTGQGSEIYVSNGKQFRINQFGQWSPVHPLSERPVVKGKMLSGWPMKFTRWMFDGLGTSAQPFSQMVAEANAPGSHYVAKSEYRKFTRGGVAYENARLVFEDTETGGRKRFYEIVMNPETGLPVFIDNRINDETMWTGFYTWKVKWQVGALVLPDKSLFQFPKK